MENNNSTTEGVDISQYRKTCSWLTDAINSGIEEMQRLDEDHYVYKYTSLDFMAEKAFTVTCRDGRSVQTSRWISMGLQPPFVFISRVFAEEGYDVTVSDSGYRDDLYSPWVTLYSLEIRRARKN